MVRLLSGIDSERPEQKRKESKKDKKRKRKCKMQNASRQNRNLHTQSMDNRRYTKMSGGTYTLVVAGWHEPRNPPQSQNQNR